ncbi:MAG: hypothetical protein ACXVYY_14690 [Oryzihumus sp.]
MRSRVRQHPRTVAAAAVSTAAAAVLAVVAPATAGTAAGTVGGFGYGQLQAAAVGQPGCGTNQAGEPSLHVSKDDLVGLGSEDGLGGGSQYWSAHQPGGSGASACGLTYDGQPNAVDGVGASGGDIDTAFAPVRSSAGTYRAYVASLNLGSVDVAHSDDDGKSWSQTPVQGGLPVDDREWIAAYGADTSLLTYHDVATNDIDVLRSDDGGSTYQQVSQAIPATDYKASSNELGNLVIDHNSGSGTSSSPFDAYQSFVAPSSSGGSSNNEAFLAISSDGGHTWADKPIGCSTGWGGSLDHQFPNVSVAPNGTLWYAASNDKHVYTATSTDHGNTWTCSGPVSSSTSQAVMPWLVATDAGVDLVYYGTADSGSNPTWSVYFAQNTTGTTTGWGGPHQLMPVHQGPICEGGVSCNGGRQLLDDFAVDTDQSGWAHIAYSHDAPDLGGSGTYTGYAVQDTGQPVGPPN